MWAHISSNNTFFYNVTYNETVTFGWNNALLTVGVYELPPFPAGDPSYITLQQDQVLQQISNLISCCQVSRYIEYCAGSIYLNVAYAPRYGIVANMTYTPNGTVVTFP
jgi:hypothetical protein